MGAACFKPAGDGGPEAVNESWGGSIGAATPHANLSPTHAKSTPDRIGHNIKGANNALHERDVHHQSFGVESKSDSRSASSAHSSTPNQSDIRPDMGTGVNPHFKRNGKAVPFSPRRGFQILSEDAPSLKLEAFAGRQRQKPTAISPTVDKLPEDAAELDVSDDEGHSMPVEMPDTNTGWVPGGETSEFAEATAALQHYYASEMPDNDSQMPGVSHVDFKLPTLPCVRDDHPVGYPAADSNVEYEAALDTIHASQSSINMEPRLLPHLPFNSGRNQNSNQATSIFDSPFVKQSTANLWHHTSDSDVSSAAKDSVRNGGSNSAASSAVAASSKRGSCGASGVPSTPPQTSKNASPDGKIETHCEKKSKSNKSKDDSLKTAQSGISELSEDGYTLATSRSLPVIRTRNKFPSPHFNHVGMNAMGDNSVMGGGNSSIGGGASSIGGGGSLFAPTQSAFALPAYTRTMSMTSLGEAASPASNLSNSVSHAPGPQWPLGLTPTPFTHGSMGPSSTPGTGGVQRTTSMPIADRHMRRRNHMRSLHAGRPSSNNHHHRRRSKALSPELAALLGRSIKNKQAKDKDRDGQSSATKSSVSKSDTTDSKATKSRTSNKRSTPVSVKSNSSQQKAAEKAAAKEMQAAVSNAAKMQQHMHEASQQPAPTSPHMMQSMSPMSPQGMPYHSPVATQLHNAAHMHNAHMQAAHMQAVQMGMGQVSPVMPMHAHMAPQMPNMHAQMAAVQAAAAQQQAMHAQMCLVPQHSRSSSASSISLNSHTRKGAAVPMYGFHPHMPQPQAIMHAQMGAPANLTGMPGMVPGVMPQHGMIATAAPSAPNHISPHPSRGSLHHESKDSSEKSSGNDSQNAAKKSEAHRNGKFSPAGAGNHTPRNLPRPARSASRSHAGACAHHHQGMSPASGADAVAHIHVDGAVAPLSKAYGSSRHPRSNGSVRR